MLATRGPNAFQAFCESLKADLQEHVVDLYLTPKEEEKQSADGGNRLASSEETGIKSTSQQPHVESSSYIKIHSQFPVQTRSDAYDKENSAENSCLAITGARFPAAQQPRPHSSPPRLVSPPDSHHQLIFQYSSKKSHDPNQNFCENGETSQTRYQFQHYIADPAYVGLNGGQPRDISHKSLKNIHSLHPQNDLPRRYVGNSHILIRNDSIGKCYY